MDYVLDACALIALFNDEEGADTVAGLIARAADGAETVLESIYASPIIVLHNVSRDIIRDAARFKTTYSMSLADAFAAATAKSLGAVFVTKDGEMKEAENAGEFSAMWLER